MTDIPASAMTADARQREYMRWHMKGLVGEVERDLALKPPIPNPKVGEWADLEPFIGDLQAKARIAAVEGIYIEKDGVRVLPEDFYVTPPR